MWTFTLAHEGLRTGQSSTPAPLTPGYRFRDASDQGQGGASSPCSKAGERTRTDNLLMNFGFISVFVVKWMCVCFGGEFN